MKLNTMVLRILVLISGVLGAFALAQADDVDYFYDNLDRLIRAEYSDGAVIEYSYDASGNRINHVVKPANLPPVADAGSNRMVRLNSKVSLSGAASSDPDDGPAPLSFAWTQTAGANLPLTSASAKTPQTTPNQPGQYTFQLIVNDGAVDSQPATITLTVPPLGDVDSDGDVDRSDSDLISAARNKPASGVNDPRDLDGNSIINALDARKAVTLCTRPRCATF